MWNEKISPVKKHLACKMHADFCPHGSKSLRDEEKPPKSLHSEDFHRCK